MASPDACQLVMAAIEQRRRSTANGMILMVATISPAATLAQSGSVASVSASSTPFSASTAARVDAQQPGPVRHQVDPAGPGA